MYVTQIHYAIAKIVYPIRYDIVGANHNLMGMIDDNAAYAIKYGESFLWPARLGIYASDIDTLKDASLDIRKKEDVHKATIYDWEFYEVAEIKASRFIVRIVTDVLIYPLSKGSPTFYAENMPKELVYQI